MARGTISPLARGIIRYFLIVLFFRMQMLTGIVKREKDKFVPQITGMGFTSQYTSDKYLKGEI